MPTLPIALWRIVNWKFLPIKHSKVAKALPAMLLLCGTLGLLRENSTASWALRKIRNRFYAEVKIHGRQPLNRDVFIWLAAHGFLDMATPLVVADHDEAIGKGTRYLPLVGSFTFYHNGNKMCVEKKSNKKAEYYYRGEARDSDDPSATRQSWSHDGPTSANLQTSESKASSTTSKSLPNRIETRSPTFIVTSLTTQVAHVGATQVPGQVASWPASRSERLRRTSWSRALKTSCERTRRNGVLIAGSPYRRRCLMYGPPGTGKTSSVSAMAEELKLSIFKLSIYVLTMTDNALDDQALEFLFNCLEDHCIVLLEDVDCAGIGLGLTKKSVNYIDRDGTTQTKDVLKGLTLNGLLNVIDGPASRDGRVLLLTTNDPNSLDKALIRAGRCDERILFGYACAEVSSQLFRQIFALTEDEIQRGVTNTFTNQGITELASQFAGLTPPDIVAPAEISIYLLDRRRDPLAAVAGAQAFFDHVVERRESGQNVAEFANEIGTLPANRGKGEVGAASDDVSHYPRVIRSWTGWAANLGGRGRVQSLM